MKISEVIYTIIGHTLSFPFFFGIALVSASLLFLKWIINYVRFGGESIAYTERMQRKTIQDVFVELQSKQRDK